MKKIYMSAPAVNDRDLDAVTAALRGGWIAPLGPEVDAFESELAAYTKVPHAVALSSGTAALELGLRALGVRRGDEIITSTLTFAATAFAAVNVGAVPVFLDVEGDAWGLDPDLLEQTLKVKAAEGRLPAAVIPVDLLGRTANYDRILPICEHFEVPVLVDSAESLGATHHDTMAGSMGAAAVFSFNGNKILTTSGGGILVSHDQGLVEKARFWSTQAREDKAWYEHREIGTNYRMSNILAALGRSQLRRLPEMIARRRTIRETYSAHLAGVVGDPSWGIGNNWLTCLWLDTPGQNLRIQAALAAQGIEARPVWKPMHSQPVFVGAEAHVTGVADGVFEHGLCLPTGVGLSDDDIVRVIHAVQALL